MEGRNRTVLFNHNSYPTVMGLPQNSSPIMAKIKLPESPNCHSFHRDISRSFWPIYDPAVLRAALSLHYRQLAGIATTAFIRLSSHDGVVRERGRMASLSFGWHPVIVSIRLKWTWWSATNSGTAGTCLEFLSLVSIILKMDSHELSNYGMYIRWSLWLCLK